MIFWGGKSLAGRTDLHVIASSTLTAVRYRDEISRATVRSLLHTCCSGHWVPLSAGQCLPSCGQSMQASEGVDAIDCLSCLPDLNPIEHLCDVMYQYRHHVPHRLSCSLLMPWFKSGKDSSGYHLLTQLILWAMYNWLLIVVLSLYKSKESLSVCVCLKYLCGSGADWPEHIHMAAAWFKGVQRRICLDYNDTVNLFQKCFTNSTSIPNRSHHSHVHTRANYCRVHRHPPP